MKKISLSFCFLFSLLTATSQNILTIWRNNEAIEFHISEIDSITFSTDAPEAIGVFSVASNKTVAFAPGNLQYIPSSSTWLFAAQQYE